MASTYFCFGIISHRVHSTIRFLRVALAFSLLIGTTACSVNPFSSASNPSDFYGLETSFLGAVETFKITGYSPKEGVSYTYKPAFMNKDIYAWGRLKGYGISITITNNSKSPIQTNYFSDSFAIMSTNDTIYNIDKGSISSYPDEEYINPGESVTYRFTSPIRGLRKSQVEYIGCQLGIQDPTLIFLVPLPTPL
jgi:hypothetical protein